MASQFEPLLDSIRAAVRHENWLAALAVSLMLPDICANIEWPRENSSTRYRKWWAHNFAATYKYGTASDYVTGEEVYKFRCAYLHEGSEVQSRETELSAVIDKFQFTISKPHHLIKEGNIVWLDVPTFCENMCDHVESWETKILSKNPDMETRAKKLLKIYIVLLPSGISSTGVITEFCG